MIGEVRIYCPPALANQRAMKHGCYRSGTGWRTNTVRRASFEDVADFIFKTSNEWQVGVAMSGPLLAARRE
jgi:hypothetical protein